VLAVAFELVLELVGGIEVVFYGTLVATRDEDHVPYAGCVRFLDGVLDERLVHDRQHLFGLGLGGWKEASAEARDWEYRLTNFCEFVHGPHK